MKSYVQCYCFFIVMHTSDVELCSHRLAQSVKTFVQSWSW